LAGRFAYREKEVLKYKKSSSTEPVEMAYFSSLKVENSLYNQNLEIYT
jgi:hypothetical protein